MNLLRYLILALICFDIPAFVREYSTDTAASFLSYLTFALLLLFYFLNKKHKPVWPLVIFALAFFIISGLVYTPDGNDYFVDFAKYLIIIICGAEIARSTSSKELLIVLVLAISSILVHTVVFPFDYGRYGGFFVDPNAAGFVCLMACALTYQVKNEKFRLMWLFVCTFCGILTLSRSFLLLWVVINLIAIFQNKKYMSSVGLGIGVLLIVLSLGAIFQLNTERLSIVENIISDRNDFSGFSRDSRLETWKSYYKTIVESPFIGNGYRSFAGIRDVKAGVHNAYLRVIGEAGIIPFLIFVGFYAYIIFRSFKFFRSKPYLPLLSISIFAFLLTTHNFINSYIIPFISIWLFIKVIASNDAVEVKEYDEIKI